MLLRFALTGAFVVVAWGAVLWSAPVVAQDDDPQATIEALQTKVAELESMLTPTPESAMSGEAGDDLAGTSAAGPGLDGLPSGNPGELSVISYGPLEGNSLPIVIRNNTDNPVSGISVNVEVRDSAGSLVAALQTSLSHSVKPWVVESGGIAIGYILDNTTAPTDATYTFDVSQGESNLPADFNVDLEVEEAEWREDRVVGVLRNPAETAVSSIWLNLVCLSEDGTAIVGDPGHIEGQIEAGGTVPFQFANGFSDYSRCERFLVAATAHPTN